MAAMIEDTSSPLALALSLADLYAGSVNEPFTLAVANQNYQNPPPPKFGKKLPNFILIDAEVPMLETRRNGPASMRWHCITEIDGQRESTTRQRLSAALCSTCERYGKGPQCTLRRVQALCNCRALHANQAIGEAAKLDISFRKWMILGSST